MNSQSDYDSNPDIPPPPRFRPLRGTRRRARSGLPLKTFLILFAVIAFVTAVVLGSGLFGYVYYYRDRVIPGVSVLGEPVGGLSSDEAAARLRDRFSDPALLLAKLGGEPLILRDGAREYRAWPWEIGWQNDFSPAVHSALAVGHSGDLTQDLPEQMRVLLQGTDISVASVFDASVAQHYLDSLALQVDVPPRDMKLMVSGLQVVETAPVNGRQLDRVETLRRIQARMLGQVGGQVEIAVKQVAPRTADPGTVKAQVGNFLAAPLLLTFNEREWALDQAALAGMIELKIQNGKYVASLNRTVLTTLLQRLTREVNQPVRDARLHFDAGVLTPTVTSQEGRLLDVDATIQAVEARFAQAAAARPNGNASPLDALEKARIPLSVRVTKPAVDLANLDKMGIKEVVSVGTTNFAHSIPGRIINVNTSAQQFDGVVVPPGATFSFAQYLGDVVEANGYEDAYVIFGDKTVLEPGGGVCQVSSTMFRAAFFGGFPIVERWAHDYRVGYYEPPVGLDATVFAPSVDFKFKNDTGAYLLISMSIDIKNTTLTYTFYGTKPTRKVSMEGPTMDKVIKAPAPLYTNDPTLKQGVVKQVDFSADGAEVTVYRIIEDNGKTTREKFVSKYKPWQARFLVGTKPQ